MMKEKGMKKSSLAKLKAVTSEAVAKRVYAATRTDTRLPIKMRYKKILFIYVVQLLVQFPII